MPRFEGVLVKLPEMVIEHSKVPDAVVSGVAGFAPDLISMMAPEPMSVARAAPIAWAEAAATVSAMRILLRGMVSPRQTAGGPVWLGQTGQSLMDVSDVPLMP